MIVNKINKNNLISKALGCLLLCAVNQGAYAIYDSETIGTVGGKAFREDCGVGQVLVGVATAVSPNRMDAMAPICVEADANGVWQSDPIQKGELHGKRFNSSADVDGICPRNHAVIGFYGSRGQGAFVNMAGSVQLICSPLVSAIQSSGEEIRLDLIGEIGDAPAERFCQNDYAARGLFGAAGSHVDYYGVICTDQADMPSGPNPTEILDRLVYIPSVGGEGGTDFREDCGAGSVLVGLAGEVSANRLDAIAPLCVDVDETGTWLGNPEQLTEDLFGKVYGSSASFNSVCPRNFAVVGYSGGLGLDNFAGIAGSIQLHCRPLTSSVTTTPESAQAQVSLAVVGNTESARVAHYCDDGFPARALYGSAGGHLDRYGFGCIGAAVEYNYASKPGRWSAVFDWPLIAIHSVLTPSGEVLTYGTDENGVQGAQFFYDIWNPQTNQHTAIDNTLVVDSFCSAPLIIPETKEIIMPGGDARYGDGKNKGIVDAPIIDVETRDLKPGVNMSFARWYPTATTLANGEILVAGGIDLAGNVAITPEIYSPEDQQWRSLFGAANPLVFAQDEKRWWYPRHWLAPNGLIFGLAGSYSYYLNPVGDGAVSSIEWREIAGRGRRSTAVMYRPGLILQVGGQPRNGATIIDINGASPQFRNIEAPIAGSRESWADSTVLPDGTVLLTGGSAGDNVLEEATYTPELWDPETETWQQLPDSKLARLYHSTALLLLDGRVLIAGGGAPGPLVNTNAEIYSPGYLFNDNGDEAVRPSIDVAPQQMQVGSQITLQYQSQKPIRRVTLIKSGAVTHSFNMEQRFIELNFETSGAELRLSVPENANELPPGYYTLFILDDAGTPSIGHMIEVSIDKPEVIITIEDSEFIGSGGGKAFRQDCGEGAVLVGVKGAYKRRRMDAIAPMCVAVDAAGKWKGQPQQQGELNGRIYRGSKIATALCPENHGVTGYIGTFGIGKFKRLAGSIQLQCAELDSSFSTKGATSKTMVVGKAIGVKKAGACKADFAARGLFGGAGSLVDRYGLICNSSN